VNAIVFGGTGMVGQGVLRECLLDPSVASVSTVGRHATGRQHPKLHEIVACFYCQRVLEKADINAAAGSS
jgi:hypothetical protein